MGNTSEGAKKAVRTKKKKTGNPNVMREQGRKGGKMLWEKIRHGGLQNPL